MTGLGILILVVVFFWVIWPVIARWLKRKAMERAEDYVRSSMGMPPRDKKAKKATGYDDQRTYQGYYERRRKNPFADNSDSSGPIIPKEYAEDVEYTEMKDYSASDTEHKEKVSSKTYHESQISDVEWTEVKKSGS